MDSVSIMHRKGGGSQPPVHTMFKPRTFKNGLPFDPTCVRCRGIRDRRSPARAEEIALDLFWQGLWDGNCNIFIRDASRLFDSLYIKHERTVKQLKVRRVDGTVEVDVPKQVSQVKINIEIVRVAGFRILHWDATSLDELGQVIEVLDESTAVRNEALMRQLQQMLIGVA